MSSFFHRANRPPCSIPIVIAVTVFYFLHRKNVKRERQEDAKYHETDLDYGLDDPGKKRRTLLFGGGGEKQSHRANQLSMDMNLSSPYLLPPGVNQSRESMNSLTKSIPNEQDPYRTVPLYPGDGGSIRSFARDNHSPGASMAGSKRQSMDSMPPANLIPPRTVSKPLPQPDTPTSLSERSDPFATPRAPEPAHHLPGDGRVPDENLPVQPIVPEIGTVHQDDQSVYEMPDVATPPAAVSKDPYTGFPLPGPPADHNKFELPELPAIHNDPTIGAAQTSNELPADVLPYNQGLGHSVELPTVMTSQDQPLPPHPHDHNQMDGHMMYDDQANYPHIQTTEYYEDDQGYAMDHGHEQDAYQEGLGVPQVANKRLSVGLRPLPPDEVTESEDPEYRANRIRSFYKEYFEDSRDAPPLPTQGGYYDDYDAGYLGEAAYYDADTNAFVMPYAQPVTRRAMTPPPGGRRGAPGGLRGPRGPGSVGGMSLPGGRGRPRAGSAFGPRPGSSASAAFRGQPKKKLPPPSVLSTLPTPSKLRDDSFAIFNATDFAPPDRIKDQAAGRSQSPLGERRPYKQSVPVASPLVTAFDELAALPSPHMLRKSSTFTGLDFAPPKKFKDGEATSDAGSIKSSRSGISAVQLGAIRSGAGRVSRLPGDTIFAKAKLGDQLKPQWGMRP